MSVSAKRVLSTTFILVGAAGMMALVLATTAQAGLRLYSGELRIVGFGNDTTTGTVEPYNTSSNYGAYPIGSQLKCNRLPYHPFETVTLMNHQAGSASTTAIFTIPAYGGNAPVVTKHGGAPTVSNPATRAAGCTQSKVQIGKPIKVNVLDFKSAFTTSVDPLVRGFTIPAYDFSTQTNGGSFSDYTQYIFGITSADLKNETGNFAKNNGPGSFVVEHLQGQQLQGRVTVTAGPNQFGGVMRLIGFYKDDEGYYRNGHISLAEFTWLFDYVGASAMTSGGVVTAGYFKSATAMLVSTQMGQSGTSQIGMTGFPWTTGAALVEASRGPFPTVMKRTGYDNRTAGGSGTIQLVSPMLAHWTTTGFDNETGSIGILKLAFAPEPQSWAMLGAGGAGLALLYRSNRSRRKSD